MGEYMAEQQHTITRTLDGNAGPTGMIIARCTCGWQHSFAAVTGDDAAAQRTRRERDEYLVSLEQAHLRGAAGAGEGEV